MHDVVPPSLPRDTYGRSSRRKRPAVQINWKLPARLRKPVRQQLIKERKRQKQKQSIIRFDRRPILTKKPSVPSSSKRPLQPAVGLPPYAGRYTSSVLNRSYRAPVARPRQSTTKPKRDVRRALRVPAIQDRPVQKKIRATLSRRVDTRTQSLSRPAPQPVVKESAKSTNFPLLHAERDVPFNWQDYKAQAVPVVEEKQIPVEEHVEPEPVFYAERKLPSLTRISESSYQSPEVREDEVEVVQPQSRFSLPFTLNVWPKSIWPAKKKLRFNLNLKKNFLDKAKTVNLSLLLVGSLAIGAVMWNLQGIGKGLIAFHNVQDQAGDIYNHLLAAQSALAETDFDATEEAFSSAENILREARLEIDEAFAASGYVLRYLDVTGTVRSGDKLLLAGEKLTQAGQHSARAFSLLLSSKLVISEVNEIEEDDVPLIKAISLAKEEIERTTELLDEADKALQGVDSPFLPEEVASQVEIMKTAIPKVSKILKEFASQSDVMLDVLGASHSRQYLMLFANNHEIRPVGGFLGSIGLVNVDRGIVEKIDVKSVYDMDGQLKEFISPPDPLLPITDRWFMRDANWFVDYTVSAKKIAEFFEKQGGPTVDGVILMTPQVIKNLLEISGPLYLPQYDLTVTKDNFYLVTQDQVTYAYDQEENKPKQFLADLTPILLNTLFSDEDKTGIEIIGVMSRSLRQKDLLLYFKNEDLQQNLVELGFAGKLPEEAQGLLMVNNANIGGHKSDQFIDQEIDYRSTIKDNNDVEVVLTIRRTHNGPTEALDYDYPETEDPAYKTNNIYQRVLVPKGAELIEAKGFALSSDIPSVITQDDELPLTVDSEVARWQSGQRKGVNDTVIGEEAGYTFFANWVVTKPGDTTVVLYRYILPGHAQKTNLFDSARRYSVYFAKQPGDMRTTVRASIDVPADKKIVYTVPPEGITQHSASSIVYRGMLQEDLMVGAVFSKK